MATALLITGLQLMVLTIAAVAVLRNPRRRLRARLRLLPVRPLDERCPAGSEAAIEGAVAISADDALQAPLSGRPCVYWRVAGELYYTGRRARRVFFHLEERRDFWIETDGRRARILVQELDVDTGADGLWLVPEERLADGDLGATLTTLVGRVPLSIERQDLVGIMLREEVVLVGETAWAAGRVHHEPDLEPGPGRPQSSYREAPSSLHLRAPGLLRPRRRPPRDLVAHVLPM
jgi:hypothetical protein